MDFDPDLDYYEVLQVSAKAEPEVIAKAYRVLASKYHPDVSSAPDAEERMRVLNRAYAVLGDAADRLEYDRQCAELDKRSGRSRGKRGRSWYTEARARMQKARPSARSAGWAFLVAPSTLALGSFTRGCEVFANLDLLRSDRGPVIADISADQDWIRVSPASVLGYEPVIRVDVDTTSLAPDRSHHGNVIISAVGAGAQPLKVPVSVRVESERAPALRVSPAELDFGIMSGEGSRIRSLRVWSESGVPLVGAVCANKDWLQVSQSCLSAANTVIEVIVDAAALALAPGRVSQGRITINTNGGDAVIPVLVASAPVPMGEPAPRPDRPDSVHAR